VSVVDTELEEEILWANGMVFFKSDDDKEKFLPPLDNCCEWMKGFCAAMADYDLNHENSSIQEALVNKGIKGELLEVCLISAETIFSGDEWERIPDVPIRATC